MSDGRTQSKQGPTDFHFTSSRLHFGPERIVALLLYLLVPIILRLLVSIILHLLVLMILHWTMHQCSDLNNTHSYILCIIYYAVDFTVHCTRAQTASSHLLLRALILPIGAISTRLHTAYLSILDDFKGILHQKIFYRLNLIFWIVMGCGIARFGRRGLKTTET